jgi:caffeoyl-CoA O-methyltransferase
VNFIPSEIDDYCIDHSIGDSKILNQLKQFTINNEVASQMMCGQLIGGLLQFLIHVSHSKKILEIGMFTGYSTLKMAEALPKGGEIHTCEINQNHINSALKWFVKSEDGKKIKIHNGDALKTIENFKIATFDFLFVDADKLRYPDYFRKGLNLLKSGGIGVFDNMLWSGSVLNPKDEESKAINETNIMIKKSKKVKQLLLPIRDGLMLFQKL